MNILNRRYLKRVYHHKAYVCVEVYQNMGPVLIVSRDEDDDWAFLCGSDHSEHVDDEWAFTVGKGHVLEGDLSLLKVAKELPRYGVAERASADAPWVVSVPDR